MALYCAVVAVCLSPMGISAATVTRGPYLQMASPTNMMVCWGTDTSTNSWVRYGAAPGSLSMTATSGAMRTKHTITLTGLSPRTRYYYSIGTDAGELAGNDTDHFFLTSPTPGYQGLTRMWVVGDSGTGDINAMNVRDAYYGLVGTNYTHLFLMLGDNAYSSGTDQEYQDKMFDIYPAMLRQTPVWPTLGNHDGYSASSSTQTGPYYDIFYLPTNAQSGGVASGTEAYYSYDFANAHLVSLNSFDVSRATGGTMANWLRDDLAATTQEWRIAYWHHPPYSKGSHDSDIEAGMVEMRQNLLPILESNGVDIVMTGHSHSYERSYHIHGFYGKSGTLDTNTMFIDGGDGRTTGDGPYNRNTTTGTVYVVAGSSGKTSGGTLNHVANYKSANSLGSVIINIVSNRLDASFLTSSSQVLDDFTIVHDYGDMDKDRVPDEWEMRYFGHLNEDLNADADNDSFSNLKEYSADTDPTNSVSSLQIQNPVASTNGIFLDWDGGPDSWQFLERSMNSVGAGAQWSLIYSSAPPGSVSSFLDTTATNTATKYFYRIRSRRPPSW